MGTTEKDLQNEDQRLYRRCSMTRTFIQEIDRIIVVEDRRYRAAHGILYRALIVFGIAVAACLRWMAA